MAKVLCRGAEAVLSLEKRGREKVLVKDRVVKGYRIPQLDEEIRLRRTRFEERLLSRARRAGVDVPRVLGSEGSRLVMDFVDGERLKDALDKMKPARREGVCRLIGEAAAKLHSVGVMHGDLTTSNMILKGGKLYFIDFGLGKLTQRVEDCATDLFLLYEALKSTHFAVAESCWQTIIKVYRQKYTGFGEVLARVEKIKTRRRYK